jgi:type 1 glutamine amidotransferase
MRRVFMTLILLAATLLVNAQAVKHVLVFSKTARYHHESIPAGIKAIERLGSENNFTVYATTDSNYFTDDNLKKYAAVIFCNTSGNVLSPVQKAAMERYIQAGGGFMGIHCASSTEKEWTWYGHLVGAVFIGHPEPQEGVIDVVDRKNPSTKQLPARWNWKDEWYNFKDIQPDLHVLFKADETTYKGGTNGANHPLAWYHEFDGGRSFYTALGHFDAAYVDPLYVKHILAGIQYAMGKNVVLDYSKAKSK